MSKIDKALTKLFEDGVHWNVARDSANIARVVWKLKSIGIAKLAVDRAVLRGKIEVLKQLKSSPLGLVGEAVRSIDSVIASLEAELKKLEEK